MTASFMSAGLVVGVVIPLVWSGILAAVRGLGRSEARPKISTERFEQFMLLLMVAPTLIGLWLILAAMFAPGMVSSLPPFVRITVSQPGSVAAHAPARGLDWGTVVWLVATLLYLSGALRLLLRFVAARLRLRQILDHSMDASAAWGEGVAITGENVPPFAIGRSRIVLPHLLVQKLSPVQTALVVRHERAHLRRRDPTRFLAFGLIEIAFWFNPVVRRQIERCRLAAELACDAAATEADPASRKAYAESLVLALKHAAGDAMFCAAAVFPSGATGDYHMRIAEIMRPSEDGARRHARTPFVVALLLAGPVGLVQAGFASAVVPQADGNSGLQFSSASVAADRMEVTGNRTLILDGNASLHQSGIDVRAHRITLTSRSAAEYANGRFESMVAEGAAEVRVSPGGQKVLGGPVNLSGDRIDRNGSDAIFRGESVKMEPGSGR